MKYKWLSLFTTAFTALLGLASLNANAAVTLAGDLNCDGQVTIADAVMLHRLLNEDTTLQITPQGIENADSDLNGILSIIDVRSALAKAAETTTLAATTTTTTTTTTTVTTTTTTAAPITTTSATNAPPVVTEPPEPFYTQIDSLKISPYPFIVRRNEEVTLNVIGLPNTEYDINVYYSSGVSKAKGLENKISDANGYVSWSWKIGGSTNSGNYRIDLIGGGVKTTMQFSVVD